MDPLGSLIREHEVISRIVGALEVYAQRLMSRSGVDAKDLARFVESFIQLVDGVHFAKLENILLPHLVRHGFDWCSGALAAMASEHEMEAYLVEVLRQAAERDRSWNAEDQRRIVAEALALVERRRGQHRLERDVLFPDVMSRLSPDALDELRGGLERFDRDHMQRREAALDAAEELARAYSPCPPLAPIATTAEEP